MTPDEQNRAIAEWLGKTYPCRDGEHVWKLQPAPRINIPCPPGYKCEKCWAFRWEGSAIELHDEAPATDYTADLNAMHEAEEKLFPVVVDDLNRPDMFAIYHMHLDKISMGTPGWRIRATATQRAESLLRTLGKWKE